LDIITKDKAISLGLKRYFTGVPCKRSHLGERYVKGGSCIKCKLDRTRKSRQENPEIWKAYKDSARVRSAIYRDKNKYAISALKKKYYKENKHLIKKYYKENKHIINERNKKYRDKNKAACAERGKKYRVKNKDAIKESQTKYKLENKERIREVNAKYNEENRDAVNHRNRMWRKANPLSFFLHNSLRRIFTNWLGGRKKQEEIHGYTLTELTSHLESQFVEGMSWDNRDKWHIDHIKPIALFIKEGVTDPSIVNALSNLQPLWALDNLEKGSKYDP